MRSIAALGLSALVVSAFWVGTARAADGPKAGIDIGDQVTPFDVQDITGPNKGTSLCYR